MSVCRKCKRTYTHGFNGRFCSSACMNFKSALQACQEKYNPFEIVDASVGDDVIPKFIPVRRAGLIQEFKALRKT